MHRLTDYLQQRLPAGEARLLQAHLGGCAACRMVVDSACHTLHDFFSLEPEAPAALETTEAA